MNQMIKDTPAPHIEEIGVETIKIFPYELPRVHDTTKVFIQENAVAIHALSQKRLQTQNSPLKQLATGEYYFEIVPSIETSTNINFTSHDNVYGNSLVDTHVIMGISNYYYKTVLPKIQIGAIQTVPAIFAIGKPLNFAKTPQASHTPIDDFHQGKTPLFICSNLVEAKVPQNDYADNTLFTEGYYELTLINIATLLTDFKNARLIFYEHEPSNSIDFPLIQQESNKPTVNVSGTNVAVNPTIATPGFSIAWEPTALLGSVHAKGLSNQKMTDISLEIKQGLIPFMASPIGVVNKVTLFASWFDYDLVMPLFLVNHFMQQPQLLTSLKQVKLSLDPKKGAKAFLEDSEIALINDIIALSFAYTTSFANFERYTKQEAKDSNGGARAGQIKEHLTITSQNLSLAALEHKEPLEAIDGLYEKHVLLHPTKIKRFQFKAVRQIIAALSRYIFSSFAIARGQNAFNEIVCPWTLEPIDPLILIKDNNDNYLLKSGVQYQITTKYFDSDLINKQLKPFTQIFISRLKLLQADRKLSLPEIPYQLDEVERLLLPGDINIENNQALKYLWYLPFTSQTYFKQLFLNNITTTTSVSSKQVTFTTQCLPWTARLPFPSDPELKAFIKQEYIKQVAFIKLADITINQVGTTATCIDTNRLLEYRGEENEQIYSNQDRAIDAQRTPFLDQLIKWAHIQRGDYTETSHNIWEYERTFTAEELTAFAYGDSLKVPNHEGMRHFNQGVTLKKSYARGAGHRPIDWKKESQTGVTYHKAAQRLVNNTITIKGNVPILHFDRVAIFDKGEWHAFHQKLHSTALSPLRVHYFAINNQPIESIYEIVITSLWGNEIVLHLGARQFKIPLFNKNNELLTKQKIIIG